MDVLTVTLNPCIDKTITVDSFLYGGLNRIRKSGSVLAGKGINVSRVLENSGVDTLASGFMGKCEQECDVENRFVYVDGNVRTNIKMFDSEAHITTELNESGFFADDKKTAEFTELFDELLNDCTVAVVSGSIPAGVSDDIYFHLIKAAENKNVKTILDCGGNAFSNGIKARPYAVKPNIHEMREFFGEPLDSERKIKESIKKIADFGVNTVVLSMGADGAVFYENDEFVRVKPFETEIKSTVGAGDSMVAAIAYSMLENYDLYHTASLATAMGTLTASVEGTGFCDISAAEKMRKFVIAEKF